MRLLAAVATVVLAVAALPPPSLHAQSAWTLGRTNLPDVRQGTDIAYGNGRFVAVLNGANNAPGIAWSTDGLAWNGVPTAPYGTEIRFLAGTFYLAAGNYLFRSADGVTWTPVLSNARGSLGRMATDGRSLMIAMGGSAHTLLYSTDRITFTETAPLPDTGPPNQSANIEAVAYVNGRYFAKAFVIAAGGLTARDAFFVTADAGASWTTTNSVSGASYLLNGGGRLVAGGSFGLNTVSRSTADGVTFTTGTGVFSISNGGRMGYAGGRFFFLGSLTASVDGAGVWATIAPLPPANASRQIRGIAYGNGRYVAVGYELGGTSTVDVIHTLVQAAPPVLTLTPADRAAAIGTATTFTVAAENLTPDLTYQWRRDGLALPGATAATLTLAAVQPADAGRYTVDVRNSLGTTTSVFALLTVGPAIVAPTIAGAPASATIRAGQATTLSVTPTGTAPFTYQWFRNGLPLAGATAAALTLDAPLLADAGAYVVTVTNAAGSVTSTAADLRITPISRISNLSVLTQLVSATDAFTLGYVIGGAGTTGSKSLVLRAAGPSLGALGVSGTQEDPKLETFAGSAKTGENDNWGGSPTLANAFAGVGAFPFHAGTSRDAAVATTLTSADNSVKISAATGGAGQVLAEVYDAAPDATFTLATPRLLNVSVLKPIGTGLTVGFTILGTAPKSVVIRAIGPALTPFGVTGALADPQLTLFNSASAKIGENDNWGGTGPLTAAFSAVGAFALPPTSRDAALLVELQPGGYTVQVTGIGSTTGTALVEVYEAP